MLLQHWNVGHAQVCWNVRQNPKVVDIFASLWKTKPEDLLVSFDGLSFSLPPEVTKRGYNRNNTWYHSDQSFLRNDFECIQSWVTGLDINNGDATLAFMEKSNQYHKAFKEWKVENGDTIDKADWYKLNKDEEQFYLNKNCTYKQITCPKGSLVFWDSRTVHCGVEATMGRTSPNFRAIIYLCYLPRHLYSAAEIRKRKKAFLELRTTNHWGKKLFGKNPRTYGKELPLITKINPPIVNEIGNKLI
jgi:hypothetical protein